MKNNGIHNDTMLVRAGWLIDGKGSAIRRDCEIVIRNGRIETIRSGNAQHDCHEIIDLSHCTVLPVLMDAHVHLFMSGTNDTRIREHQLKAGFDDIRPVIDRHLRQLMAYGVIGIRDGGDHQGHALRYKETIWDRTAQPVQLKVAGKAWHKDGRYGRLIGKSPMPGQSLADAIQKVSETIDHVKIVNSGINSLKHFGKETPPQFSLEEMTQAVGAAKKKRLKVMVHANGCIPVRISVEAGCDSIEHGFFMGKDNLKRMADRQVTWIPTACTMKGYSEWTLSGSIEAEVSKRNLDHQIEQIAYAREAGVIIALGTDAGSLGVFHGSGVIEELKLFLAAGFSIQEAIRCATSNPAKLLSLDPLGCLTPGMSASFIAVKGNPSQIPASIEHIEYRVIDGRAFDFVTQYKPNTNHQG